MKKTEALIKPGRFATLKGLFNLMDRARRQQLQQ